MAAELNNLTLGLRGDCWVKLQDIQFRHFKIDRPVFIETERVRRHAVIFFIGNIDVRVSRAINDVHTAATLEDAGVLLQRITRPSIIICKPGFEVQAIKKFAESLRTNLHLSTIPFVLDGSGMSAEEIDKFREARFADDVIFLNELNQPALLKKIDFLKKIKQQSSAKAIETVRNKQGRVKRAFDILVSGTALILLAPLFLIIAIAIKSESRGPVFYISKRAGKGYRIFDFFKFRTMEVGADKKIKQLQSFTPCSEGGPKFYKIQNDPRVTRVGTLLRKTSLDELPQLINVLIGDMSLVGNRPLPLYEAATLTTDEWAQRFMAPAGMTGLWQIRKGRCEIPAEHRINIDIEYSNKHSFWFDLWIIANTPFAIVSGFLSGNNE